MNPRLKIILGLMVLCLVLFYGSQLLSGGATFDPSTVASAETQMWKAYYTRDRMELGIQIITLLREQYGLSFDDAKRIGQQLAKASMKFSSIRENYDTEVLPDLIDVYTMIRDAGDESFDPEEVARAELSWWVARRTPGENSVEQVGEKIGYLYSVVYGRTDPLFIEAGCLRAEAADLRDKGQKDADWPKIEKLLKKSYKNLAAVRAQKP